MGPLILCALILYYFRFLKLTKNGPKAVIFGFRIASNKPLKQRSLLYEVLKGLVTKEALSPLF